VSILVAFRGIILFFELEKINDADRRKNKFYNDLGI